MVKNIERVAPILKFRFDSVQLTVAGERQYAPPRRSCATSPGSATCCASSARTRPICSPAHAFGWGCGLVSGQSMRATALRDLFGLGADEQAV